MTKSAPNQQRNLANFAVLILMALLVLVTIWQIRYTTPRPLEVARNSRSPYTLHTNLSYYIYPVNTLNELDYNQLINLNFTFKLQNLVCNESSPLVLILIHSSPKNFGRRKIIRETWGKYRDKAKLLFVLGSVDNATLEEKLLEENRENLDFIQGSFKDSYRNLTYKHVMLYKYVIYHCPEAKYILKTDDDVFVNMPTMINFLTHDLSPYGADNFLFCTVKKNSRPLRTYRSKWRVSFSEYPDKVYPTHCPGWFLLYSQDVVFKLYKEAQNAKYFWIDDIHLTGTLFNRLNLIHTDAWPYLIRKAEMNEVFENGGNITRPFLITEPNLDKKEMKRFWSFVSAHPVPKNIMGKV